jgi:chitodextrinase
MLPVTAIGTNSLTLAWLASTDNVGVAGYRVYRGASLLGPTPATSYAVSGLMCGQTFTFRVNAYDAAGNTSPDATISATTSACPAAVLRVAPSGNDSTCLRGDLTKACATFARAYKLANPGDVVEVSGGTYGPQDLNYDASNAQSPGVTFQEAPAATAKVTDTDFDSALEMGRDGPGSAQYVTMDGIDFEQVFIRYTGSPAVVAESITIRNAHLGTKQQAGLYSGSVRNFRLENVDFGPTCCDEDASQIAQGSPSDPAPDGVTLVNVTYHDVRNSCSDIPASAWPDCATESKPYAGNHVDCLQSTGFRNVTIRNSRFINCQTGLQMGAEKARNWNMLIENSMFSGHHWVNFTCGGPCDGDYAWVSPDSSGAQTWVKLHYNTFAAMGDGGGLRAQELDPAAQLEAVGNIIAGYQSCTISSSLGSASWDVRRSNMVGSGGVCGPGDFNGDALFVEPGRDFHLRATSPGTDRAEAAPCRLPTDMDGQARPLGSACDVGADEAG